MDPIRVLIVDDHTIFREGLASLLSTAPGIEVAGQAGSGEEAVELANDIEPQVILMDIVLPGLSGVAATQRILSRNPGIRVIMLTMLEDDETLFAAICAGARGYLLKGTGKVEALQTIETVASGAAVFGSAIAGRLAALFDEETITSEEPFPELTSREREVLDLIASGENNQAIADRLHISPRTVGNHISNIFSKLQVLDRAQAIVKARSAGLGKENSSD